MYKLGFGQSTLVFPYSLPDGPSLQSSYGMMSVGRHPALHHRFLSILSCLSGGHPHHHDLARFQKKIGTASAEQIVDERRTTYTQKQVQKKKRVGRHRPTMVESRSPSTSNHPNPSLHPRSSLGVFHPPYRQKATTPGSQQKAPSY